MAAGTLASMVRALGARLALLAACAAVPACATYQDDLANGQRAFEASEHERALAMFRVLEPDLDRLSLSDRAHYAYLRGMTDFRIGYKADARHWLAVASAIEAKTPGSLPPDWAKRLGDSLKELNEDVYTGGIASLTDTAEPTKAKASPEGDAPVEDESKKDEPKKDDPGKDAPAKKTP
jgi:hypothetical protein